MSAVHELRSAATVGAASTSPSYSVVYAHQDLRDADARDVSEIKKKNFGNFCVKSTAIRKWGTFSTHDKL